MSEKFEVDRTSHSYLLGVAEYERDIYKSALLALVRKGTNGRWYTSQHGDTDVTALVGGALGTPP